MVSWDPERFYDPNRKWREFKPTCHDEPEPVDAWIGPSESFMFGWECESPIETRLGPQLAKTAPVGYKVLCQYKWHGWRIDFAVIDSTEKPVAFIECDGAAFHSTKEQMENDRRKDAAAQEAGIRLFRFTGSKIYHEAEKCARTVWAAFIK